MEAIAALDEFGFAEIPGVLDRRACEVLLVALDGAGPFNKPLEQPPHERIAVAQRLALRLQNVA